MGEEEEGMGGGEKRSNHEKTESDSKNGSERERAPNEERDVGVFARESGVHVCPPVHSHHPARSLLINGPTWKD
jgi:hypothetical protein